MTDFTWRVIRLQTQDQPGMPQTVVRVFYTVTATDGVNTFSYSDKEDLSPADPSNYSAYSALTQDQILTWIWDTCAQGREGIEMQLQGQIDYANYLAQRNRVVGPVQTPTLPWS